MGRKILEKVDRTRLWGGGFVVGPGKVKDKVPGGGIWFTLRRKFFFGGEEKWGTDFPAPPFPTVGYRVASRAERTRKWSPRGDRISNHSSRNFIFTGGI